jgi:hypothetical protein
MKNWYNENEGRAYPLREDASRLDRLGRRLSDDIIADISLVIPNDLEDDVFLTTVVMTETLISVVVGTADEGLLVGTYPKPLTLYSPLPLDPITDDVSGFVVLGHGAAAYSGVYIFTDKTASQFAVKALHTFDALPVSAVAKLGAPALLRGVVEIQGNDNVRIRYDEGSNTVYFSLIESVRDEFVGPCARGDSISGCGIPPIRTINGITANDDGQIIVEVE